MRRLLYLPILLIPIFLAVYFKPHPQPVKKQLVPQGTIVQQITTLGGEAAYKSLKDTLANKQYGEQHSKSHEFGKALYKIEGLKGVTVCDDNFGYGCYHAFFEEAIADKGLSIITDLDQECIKKYGKKVGCQHGIGHGALSYLGNDKLSEALTACTRLSNNKSTAGCLNGIFMEYNNQTMVSQNGIVPRTLDKNSPYVPCDSVDQKFQAACYFYQPSLWLTTLQLEPNAAETLCNKLQRSNQVTCFMGMGSNITARSQFTASTIREKCDTLTTSLGKFYCRIGASFTFIGNKRYSDQAPHMCDGLNVQSLAECKSVLAAYQN